MNELSELDERFQLVSMAQLIKEITTDSSNAERWHELAKMADMAGNEANWQFYSMAIWLNPREVEYKLGLLASILKQGTSELADKLFYTYLSQADRDDERAALSSGFASQLLDFGMSSKAMEVIRNLHLDNEDLSKVRVELGRLLLIDNQPEKAIEMLDTARAINTAGNEHFMIKRSVALICAYRSTGNLEAETEQWAILRNIKVPLWPFKWEFQSWWGDAQELLCTYKIDVQIRSYCEFECLFEGQMH